MAPATVGMEGREIEREAENNKEAGGRCREEKYMTLLCLYLSPFNFRLLRIHTKTRNVSVYPSYPICLLMVSFSLSPLSCLAL